jgi:hypothetical protein
VKPYPNVFLMLCGHITDESRRTDSYNGNIIHSLRSDYQDRTNGGNGWMRLMKFSPAGNTIQVKTYSPWLNQYETDTNSQFTINYDLSPFYSLLGTTNVASGTTTMMPYDNLLPNTCYQWYVRVSDGTNTVTSPVQTFTTGTWSSPVTLNLKTYLQGFYRGGGVMASVSAPGVCDSITVELHNTLSPFSKVYSAKSAIGTNGSGGFVFPAAVYGNSYYVVAKHRSSLETWSAAPVLLNAGSVSYDFSTAANKAYGNNLYNLGDTRYAIYSGDVNQNSIINLNDFSLVEGAYHGFSSGYSAYDLNGDGIVEGTDGSLLENNFGKGVVKP